MHLSRESQRDTVETCLLPLTNVGKSVSYTNACQLNKPTNDAFAVQCVCPQPLLHLLKQDSEDSITQRLLLDSTAQTDPSFLKALALPKSDHCLAKYQHCGSSIREVVHHNISYSKSLMLSRHIMRLPTITSRSPSLPIRTTSSCDSCFHHPIGIEMMALALAASLPSSVAEFAAMMASALRTNVFAASFKA